MTHYLWHLRDVLALARFQLKPRGFLVLVIQPQDDGATMEGLARVLQALPVYHRATYRWDHGNGQGSYVVVASKSTRPRLNIRSMARKSRDWAIPVREPDPEYGFWEWPDELVHTITHLTIPQGGVVIDPFMGKGQALQSLSKRYRVYGIDVDAELLDARSSEDRMAMEDPASDPGGSGAGVA